MSLRGSKQLRIERPILEPSFCLSGKNTALEGKGVPELLMKKTTAHRA